MKTNDDGDEGDRQKMKQTTTFHLHHAILYISLPSLHHYDVKLPNFTSPRHGVGAWSRWTQHKNCPFHFPNLDNVRYGPKKISPRFAKLGDSLVLHCASLTAHNKNAAVKKSISVTLWQWSLLKRKATGIFACGRFLPRWDSMCWECA